MKQRRPRVVIVGGGFAGIEAAKTLGDLPVRVYLVDQQNHFLFQPLLYQVATAALSPGQIASPLRSILRRKRNTRVILAEVLGIDVEQRIVRHTGGILPYDYLILATGARHSYFGHPEWEWLAPGLKTVEDALEIRRRVLLAYEEAEREQDPDRRRALMTFAIIGAGPTGVELAGALAEIACKTLTNDFRTIDSRDTRILLLEGGPRVLPTFPESLSASAQRDLERLGVEVRTNTLATDITTEGVTTKDAFIPARTTLWAAGVMASPLAKSLNVPLDRAGRVIVEPDLSIPGHPEVFVVGDLALFKHQGDAPLPGIAPVAMQEGRAAAAMIEDDLYARPRRPFHYNDRGTMATIGRASGVAHIGRLKLDGLIGWLAWLVVHLYFLIGFENRVLVIIQWAWSYFTYHRGSRLITGEFAPRAPRPEIQPASAEKSEAARV